MTPYKTPDYTMDIPDAEFWEYVVSKYDLGEYFDNKDCELVAKQSFWAEVGYPSITRLMSDGEGSVYLETRGVVISQLSLERKDWDKVVACSKEAGQSFWDAITKQPEPKSDGIYTDKSIAKALKSLGFNYA